MSVLQPRGRVICEEAGRRLRVQVHIDVVDVDDEEDRGDGRTLGQTLFQEELVASRAVHLYPGLPSCEEKADVADESRGNV